MSTSSPHGRGLVNRWPQLAALRDRIVAAERGEASLCIVAGDGGAGKSRLIAEFCASLEGRGARCAVGGCLEYVQSPFAPFLAVIETLDAIDPSTLRAASALRKAIAPLLPALAEAGATATEPARDKLLQFNALADALARFAVATTTVVVIEDLQWADSATLELLLHLAPRIASSRLVIIVTFRSDELPRGHQLRSVLAKLGRLPRVHRLDLGPLTDADMRELVERALEDKAPLPAATVGAICERAEGNPLFAEELLKNVETGDRADDRQLPGSVAQAVSERVAGMDDLDRTLLAQAAAIGRRFSAEFLAAISGHEIERVIALLKRAIDLQLIAEEAGVDIHYAFRHELIREALYAELLVAETRSLHRRIADALESSPDVEAHIAELAYHYWQSHDADKAARYNESAGDLAFEFFAYRDAVTCYGRALDTGALDGPRRAALNRKFADALHQAGFGERAVRALEEALAYYTSVGATEDAARTALRLARQRLTLGDTEGHLRDCRLALELVGANPASPAFFFTHVELLGLHTSYRWDPDKAREHEREAERAVAARRPAELVGFWENRAALAIGLGRPSEALDFTTKAVEAAALERDVRAAVRCWGNYAGIMALIGEREAARGGFERALEIARATKLGGLTVNWTLVYAAYAALLEGELSRAKGIVDEALAAGIEMPSFRIHLAGVAIPLGLALDDDESVRRSAKKDLIDFGLTSTDSTLIGALAGFAERLAAQNKPDEAAALLHRALDALEHITSHPGPSDAERLLTMVAQHGDLADAPRARALLRRTGQLSAARSLPAYLALFDALERHRSKDREASTAAARDAAARFKAIGWPLLEAQALELEGKIAEASDIYKRTGATREARRLEALLNPVNRRGRTKSELTAREREICDLLVQGKANKAIAEALVISERTVETHVSSVLTKMEAGSRAELIAKLKS
jgi:DNA-binding CsgD family transcriptional regulator